MTTRLQAPGLRLLVPVVLLAAALIPYVIGLGDSAIWDANEAFYVETPREMIERGDYVSPTFNYEPRLNKPVLSYWVVAAFYSLFGVSVAVERLAITLGAFGLIAVAGFLGFLLSPDSRGRPFRVDTALWAAIGLAIAPRLLMFARRIFIDIYISLFLAMTLLFFAASERYPERRRLFLILMYGSIGLGMLTKGPVAVVLPGLAFAAYLLVHRELRRTWTMSIPLGALIVLAIVTPWYAALYLREGWGPIVSFFVGENVDRFTSGLGVRVERGPFFYLPVLLSDSFPWSLYLIPAALSLWTGRRTAVTGGDRSTRVRTLLWLWIAAFVVFFSFSAGKQDLYIFPVVPAVCALASGALVDAMRGFGTTAVARTSVIAGALLLIVGAGLIYLFEAAGASYAIEGVAAIGGIGIAMGVLAVAHGWRQRAGAVASSLAIGFVALAFVFVLETLPSFEAYKPVPGFADIISRRAAATDVVATYEQAMPSLVYYLRRHVRELFQNDDLAGLFQTGRTVFLVISEGDLQKVSPRIPGTICVIDSRPTFDVRLRSVLAREPLPQLVVITNRCG
jgi:4-amino-4-deoxy-L-arabinose transferase-like glycosyltransferase